MTIALYAISSFLLVEAFQRKADEVRRGGLSSDSGCLICFGWICQRVFHVARRDKVLAST